MIITKSICKKLVDALNCSSALYTHDTATVEIEANELIIRYVVDLNGYTGSIYFANGNCYIGYLDCKSKYHRFDTMIDLISYTDISFVMELSIILYRMRNYIEEQ